MNSVIDISARVDFLQPARQLWDQTERAIWRDVMKDDVMKDDVMKDDVMKDDVM